MERQVCQHEVWVALHQQTVVNQTPFLDYTIRNGWLYKLNFLCVPQSEDHLLFIKEAHASSCGGHFGITKTVQNLQHQFYWPSLQRRVEKFIRACTLCSQSKPSNRKHDMYQPLWVPSRPWESISMDFLSGMPTTQRKHDAIWVVVCRFSKMACSSLATRLPRLLKQRNYISIMYGLTLVYPSLSFGLETQDSSAPFGRHYGHCLVVILISPPPSTLKWMDKQR
jgi:hypothetical protein